MVHGGTNFGFTSGANYGNETDIQPDLTSYDYDAPISEAGWATDKYKAIREVMQKSVKYAIPAIPERIPVIALPKISLTKTYDLFTMIKDDKFVESDTLLSFEDLNQGSGYVLYRRHFNQPIEGKMLVKGIADYALVYVNGEKVGELNRVFDKDSLEINIPFNSTLDILVENMGRINYGARITQNRKGILGSITIDGNDITGDWKMYKIPFDNVPNLASKKEGYGKGLPVVYSGQFNVDKVGDTFLDMREWGKGIVFVNGINLGRYWKVGPQHTLYLPGCFLKKGNNDIVIFEQQNDSRKTELQGITEPILRELRK